MSKLKHTPGPWTTGLKNRSIYGPDRNFGDGVTTHVIAVINHGSQCDHSEIEGNARLIAAAPELLELLRQTTRMIESSIEGEEEHHPDLDDLVKECWSVISETVHGS